MNYDININISITRSSIVMMLFIQFQLKIKSF